MALLKLGRCPICEWPLAATEAEGCTLDSCSYRPREGSPEWQRCRSNRAALELMKIRVAADNALMDEIEAEATNAV